MYKQDKATTERHARILRELVKRPENKVCADCKRNDARWASWNIGVFICIRCSGIHRSMGTHISKVKSVDLDTWNAEQMDSIQRWGNHRANLYWEAHLRPGHIPPEHKMDSFVRSKYESRRWAREGPPPSDPSVLESSDNQEVIPVSGSMQAQPIAELSASSTPPPIPTPTNRQPRPHQLLSAATVGRASVARPIHAPATAPQAEAKAPAAQPAPPPPANDLFTLDFHSPSPSLNAGSHADQIPKKDVKSDILSLFSNPPPLAAVSASGILSTAPVPQAATDSFSLWGQQPQAQASPITSMVGQTGVGMWGVQSGWTQPTSQTAQADVWGSFSSNTASGASGAVGGIQQPGNSSALFETSNVWGVGTTGTNPQANGSNNLFGTSLSTTTPAAQKKDDVFGDLWGDFK